MWLILGTITVISMVWLMYNAPFALVDLIPFIKVRKIFSSGSLSYLDYSNQKNWFIKTKDVISNPRVDVFFVHRTTFLSGRSWNAPVTQWWLNKMTHFFAVKVQAKIFDGIANIYAPKYRQATLYSFYDEKENGQKALNLAYQDVKEAFLYYLKYHNRGNPILLVGHSQGTFHLQRLIHELFDNDPVLQKKLICAYLVAMPIGKNIFKNIQPSKRATDINCYVSWSTFGVDAFPLYFKGQYDDALCTNPVSWKNNTNQVTSPKEYKGARTYYLNVFVKPKVRVFINKGVLQINALITGFFKLRKRDYVAMDYHIFFYNIRENAQRRIKTYNMLTHEIAKKQVLFSDS